MMTSEDVRDLLGREFQSHGINGRGALWRHSGSEVSWVIHLDRLPYGNRLAIDVGASLSTKASVRRATDCPIVMHVENMKIGEIPDVIPALDLDAQLSDEARAGVLASIAQNLSEYVKARGTVSALRRAYAAGEMQSAFVEGAVRDVLAD